MFTKFPLRVRIPLLKLPKKARPRILSKELCEEGRYFILIYINPPGR